MKKKGFTLIELIAVITLLALIVLVTVPVIINTLSNTEQKESEDFKKLVTNAAELYIERNRDLYPELNEVKGYIDINADILVSEGYLQNTLTDPVDNNPISKYIINIYVKPDNTFEYKVVERKTFYELATITNEVNSIDYCAKAGICKVGTAFAIQVNDVEIYKFYVIADDGKNVTLLMATNLYADGDITSPTVAWLNQTDYEAAGGGCGYEFNGCVNSQDYSAHGPLTALRILKERTEDWTNIPVYSYDLNYGLVYVYDDNNVGGAFQEGRYSGKYVQNVRSRLPKLTDFTSTGICAVDSVCPDWVIGSLLTTGDDNAYGYWLSDAGDGVDIAYTVSPVIEQDRHITISSSGVGTVSLETVNALRPVITLSKSL